MNILFFLLDFYVRLKENELPSQFCTQLLKMTINRKLKYKHENFE